MASWKDSKLDELIPKRIKGPFKCVYCGRGLFNMFRLTRHINIHTKEYLACNNLPVGMINDILGTQYTQVNYDYIKLKHGHSDRRPHLKFKKEVVLGGEVDD